MRGPAAVGVDAPESFVGKDFTEDLDTSHSHSEFRELIDDTIRQLQLRDTPWAGIEHAINEALRSRFDLVQKMSSEEFVNLLVGLSCSEAWECLTSAIYQTVLRLVVHRISWQESVPRREVEVILQVLDSDILATDSVTELIIRYRRTIREMLTQEEACDYSDNQNTMND